MVTVRCDYCLDFRHIEPAKYINGGNEEFKSFINKAKKNKKFIETRRTENQTIFTIVEKCPMCGHVFTKDDYDSYIK